MSSQGRSDGAGPSRSHQSTTAGKVAVGGHRWSRPVERKAMIGGATVLVRREREQERARVGHVVGPCAQLGQASVLVRESAGALSGRAAGPSRTRRGEAALVTGFSFFYFQKCE
jgi:hypothetical protein